MGQWLSAIAATKSWHMRLHAQVDGIGEIGYKQRIANII